MFEIAERSEAKAHARALIVYQRDTSQEDVEILEEIQLLTASAGAIVVDTVTAFRRKPDASTYIGKGKVEEISGRVEQDGIELISFLVSQIKCHIQSMELILQPIFPDEN